MRVNYMSVVYLDVGSRVKNCQKYRTLYHTKKKTRARSVSCVWDHAHWIPGEILPHFDPSHLSVAQRDQKLENHVSTREGHMSHVWDHAY